MTSGLAAGYAGCGGGTSGTTTTGGSTDSTTAAGSTTASSSTSTGSGGAGSTTAASASASSASSSAAGTGGGGGAPPCAGCTVVAALQMGSAPYGLAVDASNVYWTNAGNTGANPPLLGSVMQAKTDGTGVVTLMATEDTPYAVHVANGMVYWTSYAIGGVMRRTPIGGGAVTKLVDAPTTRDFAIGAAYIWWTREPDDIQRIPVDGVPAPDSGAIGLLTGNPLSNGITSDATSVYWVNKQDGYIKRSDFDFANETPLATGDIPWDIEVDATSVYWTEAGSSPGVGKVMKAAKADGASPVVIAMGQATPHGIAVDGTGIYWANKEDGTINKAPLAGGAITVLAKGQMTPENVAVDATHVYWTDPKADLVVRVGK
ncbi:MAG: hypothetical protein ABJE95_18750 [Byssovorax sp.]